jgi:ATP synthase protein I
MIGGTTRSGEMSQASNMSETHPKHVDPASRRGRGVYDTLSSSSIGLEFGLSVIIGLVAGWWLDKELGTGPWLTILMLCCGFAAGVRGVLRAVKRADRAAERDKKDSDV